MSESGDPRQPDPTEPEDQGAAARPPAPPEHLAALPGMDLVRRALEEARASARGLGTLRANPLRAPVPTKQHGYQGTGHVLRPTNAYGAAHTVRQRAFSARWIATALRRIRDCF